MTYNSTTDQTEVTLPYLKSGDEVAAAVSSEGIASDYSLSFVPNSTTPVYARLSPQAQFSETETSAFITSLSPAESESFSFGVWVYFNDASNQCVFYKQTNDSSGWKECYLDLYNGSLRFFVGNSYNVGFEVKKAFNLTKQWVFVTCIYDRPSFTLRLKTSDSATITSSPAFVLQSVTGFVITPSNFDLNGKISGIGLWAKILSSGDSTELETGEGYNEFSTSLKTSLNGWWSLDEPGSVLKIESQNKLLNFNIISGVTQSDDSPRKTKYKDLNQFSASDVIPIVSWSQTATNLKVFLTGNRTSSVIYLGILYAKEHSMSRISLRSPGSKGGQMVVNTGNFNLRYGNLNFSNTKEFKVVVASKSSDKGQLYSYTKKFKNPKSGVYKFPIFLNANEAKITFFNESPYPSSFMSMDIEGFYATQSRKAS